MNFFAILLSGVFFFARFASCDEEKLCFTIQINFRDRTIACAQSTSISDCSLDDVDENIDDRCSAFKCKEMENYSVFTNKYSGCNLTHLTTQTNCNIEVKNCLYTMEVKKSNQNLQPCNVNKCEFTAIIITSLPRNTATDSTSASDSNSTLKTALIATFVVAFVIIVFLIIVICRLRRRKIKLSSQTKLDIKPHSQLHDHNGDRSTKSQDQVDPSGSRNVPHSGNHLYDRPDVDDIEIQPYWEPFHNESAAILPDSQFPCSVISDNCIDGYDAPFSDLETSSVMSPEPADKPDCNAGAGDKPLTSQNSATVHNYFVLEGGHDDDDATTSVSGSADTVNKAGQYAKLGEVIRKTEDAYGMVADKTDAVVTENSLLPENERSNKITTATTVAEPASVYCLAGIGQNSTVAPVNLWENSDGTDILDPVTKQDTIAETSVNYFELENSKFDTYVHCSEDDNIRTVPSFSDKYSKLGDIVKTSKNTYNTLNEF